MQINKKQVEQHNEPLLKDHRRRFDFIQSEIPHSSSIIKKLIDFQVAIPSWALGTGGTRFGRFSGGGEPRNLEEKIEDVGLLHALNQSGGAISLHIHGSELVLLEREIDQDEPLWATRLLLNEVGSLRESAELLREKDPNCAILQDIAEIWDERATQLIEVARLDSGKQKVDALYN